MRIRSSDVPQADKLRDVIRLVDAVATGARTYQQMARAIGKVGRQGRYYRRAAEILGFIKKEGKNNAAMTVRGWALVNSGDGERRRLVKEAVLGTEMFQRVVPVLISRGAQGLSRLELRRLIEGISAPVGPSMMPRRVSSVIDWLSEIGLLARRGKTYCIKN
jgi:hypothetical protein